MSQGQWGRSAVALMCALAAGCGGDDDGGDASSRDGFAVELAKAGCDVRAFYLDCALEMGERLCMFEPGEIVVVETCRNAMEGEVLTSLIDRGIVEENWDDYAAVAENCLTALNGALDAATCGDLVYEESVDCYHCRVSEAIESSCEAFFDPGLIPI